MEQFINEVLKNLDLINLMTVHQLYFMSTEPRLNNGGYTLTSATMI